MKPLTPAIRFIHTIMSLALVASVVYWSASYGIATGLIALITASIQFHLYRWALDSQYASPEKAHSSERSSSSNSDACTNKTKEDESN
jgi:hypothetical protein